MSNAIEVSKRGIENIPAHKYQRPSVKSNMTKHVLFFFFLAALTLPCRAETTAISSTKDWTGYLMQPLMGGTNRRYVDSMEAVETGRDIGWNTVWGTGSSRIRKRRSLLSDVQYSEFELELSLKPDWGPDSGVFVRTDERGGDGRFMSITTTTAMLGMSGLKPNPTVSHFVPLRSHDWKVRNVP